MTLEEHARQAFGSGATFYLAEIANTYDQNAWIAKKQKALERQYISDKRFELSPAEEKLLASGIASARKRNKIVFLQRKHDVAQHDKERSQKEDGLGCRTLAQVREPARCRRLEAKRTLHLPLPALVRYNDGRL